MSPKESMLRHEAERFARRILSHFTQYPSDEDIKRAANKISESTKFLLGKEPPR